MFLPFLQCFPPSCSLFCYLLQTSTSPTVEAQSPNSSLLCNCIRSLVTFMRILSSLVTWSFLASLRKKAGWPLYHGRKEETEVCASFPLGPRNHPQGGCSDTFLSYLMPSYPFTRPDGYCLPRASFTPLIQELDHDCLYVYYRKFGKRKKKHIVA